MAYLLPPTQTPRRRRLGVIVASENPKGIYRVLTNAGAVFPVRDKLLRTITPAPAPSTAPQPIGPITTPITIPVESPISNATAGTPVPSGFPTNQFFVNQSDGSVWEYSGVSGKWVNTGTPYNINAPAAAPAPTTTTSVSDAGTPTQPVSVSVAAPSSESTYQTILDWLTQQTLISGVPNWTVAAVTAGALLWLKSRSERRR